MNLSSANFIKSEKDKSLSERLLEELFGDSEALVNFDDLSGITYDLPELFLNEAWHIHRRPFCLIAKNSYKGGVHCSRNKYIANQRCIHHGKRGITGMCHMGLTDMAVPWIIQGQVLGVFYLGSAIRKGSEKAGLKRLELSLKRRRSDSRLKRRLFTEYRKLPKLDASDFKSLRIKIDLAIDVMTRLVVTSGVPLERYPLKKMTGLARERIEQSAITQRAILYAHQHYDSPLNLKKIAAFIPCHPDTLCRIFQREMRMGLPDYIQQVRINHASNLLLQGKLSNGEISFRAGFQTQSHFNRIFKKLTGLTPNAWRDNARSRQT